MKEKVRQRLKEKNAILLVHNYQPPEIQDVADLCGDSLELSVRASRTDADIIVFAGVRFMAETAAILSPEKTVLLPDMNAGCPMADMITPEKLKAELAGRPAMPVVTYVNSTADVKALSTICCTSANVVKVLESLDADEVLMAPDRNLAQYGALKTGKKVVAWDGYCPYHDRLTTEEVKTAREAHPDAVFLAHPECRPEILEMADMVSSTSGMIRYASESAHRKFIIGTEIGILYPLRKANPGKHFYPASMRMECIDMKKITLENILESLDGMRGRVSVPENIRIPALQAVQRMIDLP